MDEKGFPLEDYDWPWTKTGILFLYILAVNNCFGILSLFFLSVCPYELNPSDFMKSASLSFAVQYVLHLGVHIQSVKTCLT